MSKAQWRRAWRFVRQHWPQIDCGNRWGLLSTTQKIAAITLNARNNHQHHQTPAEKLALPF